MMNIAEYRRIGARLADYLPWAALVGEGVVLNKDGSFQRSARFRGPDLDSSVPAELVGVAGRLNNAFRRLGSGWSIFVEAQRHEAASYPRSTFPDRTDRVLALLDGFMPECDWLDDTETLTYLHSTVSTKRHRVRVPETPMYLDALLADQPLAGGLEPRLGDAHLRVLT
ncbi:MAG: conjugal transfer protein TrbE, partial [Mesorhizobium sp.]